ncbi:MAG: TraX family protein [Rhodospirillales bacterium]
MTKSENFGVQTRPRLTSSFDGAPLDMLKLFGALSMVADHVNSVILGSAMPLLWRIGRVSFPLFCFAIACNLLRGANTASYAWALLLVGVVTQPIFGIAFAGSQGNILFTLGLGVIVATALRTRSLVEQHAVFAVGVAAVLVPAARAYTGVEFGLAGILLPALLLMMMMQGGRSHAVWLLPLVFALNLPVGRSPHEAWWMGPTRDASIALIGGLAALAFAWAFKGRPRFLPRYALYAFYPGHLLALAALRALI